MDKEYRGRIMAVRAVEDAIRASHKYTEGIKTMLQKHPKLQGEDFAARRFCKYYEVYPDVIVSMDMPLETFIDWIWGDKRHIDVVLTYDYRCDKAGVVIKKGNGAVQELSDAIPGFGEAIRNLNGAA